MTERFPNPIIIPARDSHTVTVILIHGFGGRALRMVELAKGIASGELCHVKWILPNAPIRPTTVNNGQAIPAWFDIRALDFVGSVKLGRDEEGMLESTQYISNLIDEEIRNGIPSHRILLGGFSQGGTMSLFVGLTTSNLLGGIFCLSGRLILRDRILQMLPNSKAREVPIFWGHGTNDPTLKYAVARSHANQLVRFLGIREIPEKGINGSLVGLIFLTYNGLGHTIRESELYSLREWMKKVAPTA